MGKLFSTSLLCALILTLSACGKKNEEPIAKELTVESKQSIPPHWKKSSSKDSMTDKVTKHYDIASNESQNYGFSVACSKKGFLNFYIEYPQREGIPSAKSEVTVRIDNEQPFNEQWYVGWINGSTAIENPYTFYTKVIGKQKLAVEIFAAAKNSFNIQGIENVVADMEATSCQFENKTIVKELSAESLPKFAARCDASGVPSFVLVTEPQKQRLFLSRQDRQNDPSISTKIKLTENRIDATVESPCCKNSPTFIEFNRQTGELKRNYSSGGGTSMQCEKLDDSKYDAELSASVTHYNEKLIEAKNKADAKQAEEDLKREEEIRKANRQNKF
jgi:hypothetical protein